MVNKYLSLVKFSHTIFALPFALIGFLLALNNSKSNVSFTILLLILLCMIFARNAAMAFNRWADAKIDASNPRTATREIPAGTLSPKQVFWFVLLNCIAFIITTFFINQLCFTLSPFVLAIILGYSYTKRFTPLCHIILGVGLAIAPIGAYLAVIPEWNIIVLLFGVVVLTWVSGFDIIYALQDVDFDKKNKLHSIPTLLGKKNALLFSSFLHVICGFVLIIIGIINPNFQFFYAIGVILFIVLLIRQHILVSPDDLSKVNLAFFTSNGIASVVLFLCVLLEFLV